MLATKTLIKIVKSWFTIRPIDVNYEMFCDTALMHLLLIRYFRYRRSTHRVVIIHLLRSCAFSIITHFPFMFFLLFFNITPPSVFLCFGIHPLLSSMFSLLHLPHYSYPHGLTISVSLLLLSHLCLPHMPLL